MPAGYADAFLTGPIRAQIIDPTKVTPEAEEYVELGMTQDGWEFSHDPLAESIDSDWHGRGVDIDHVHMGGNRYLRATLQEVNKTYVRYLLSLQSRIINGAVYDLNEGGEANVGCLLSDVATFRVRMVPVTLCSPQTHYIFPFCVLTPRFRRSLRRVTGLARMPIEFQVMPFYLHPSGIDVATGRFASTDGPILDGTPLNRTQYFVTNTPA